MSQHDFTILKQTIDYYRTARAKSKEITVLKTVVIVLGLICIRKMVVTWQLPERNQFVWDLVNVLVKKCSCVCSYLYGF